MPKRTPLSKKNAALKKLTKEELFATMNASAERTLWALMKASKAGSKKGFKADEEDQLIELLKRAKRLKEHVKRIAQESEGQVERPS